MQTYTNSNILARVCDYVLLPIINNQSQRSLTMDGPVYMNISVLNLYTMGHFLIMP